MFDSKIDVKISAGKIFVIEIETQIFEAKIFEIEIETEIWGDSMFEIVIEMRFYINYFSHNFLSKIVFFCLKRTLKRL